MNNLYKSFMVNTVNSEKNAHHDFCSRLYEVSEEISKINVKY